MNNTIKKIAIGGAGVLVMLALGGAAFADLTVSAVQPASRPMVLQVGENGNVLLRGTVSAVGANSLTIKSWGGDWMVNVSTSTSLVPGSGIGQFAVGTLVGVQGKVSTTASWTIDATLVRDWQPRQQAMENRQEVKAIIKAMTPRNWEGVAADVNNDAMTFSLTVNGTKYNVKMATGAKVVMNNFSILSFGSIKNGDTVRVYGPSSAEGMITASVVRDTSMKP